MTRLRQYWKGLCQYTKVSVSGQGPQAAPRPTAGLEGLSCWPSSSLDALPGGCWSSPSPRSCPVLSVAGDKEHSHSMWSEESPASLPFCFLRNSSAKNDSHVWGSQTAATFLQAARGLNSGAEDYKATKQNV